ncbi:hypothetical protein WA026_002410, partial [Henosepilachna vigintioctopunctata]
VERTPPSENTLRINTQALGAFRGGSLPNVSAANSSNKTSIHTARANKVNYVTKVSAGSLFLLKLPPNNIHNWMEAYCKNIQLFCLNFWHEARGLHVNSLATI